jgi:hypothetical protein
MLRTTGNFPGKTLMHDIVRQAALIFDPNAHTIRISPTLDHRDFQAWVQVNTKPGQLRPILVNDHGVHCIKTAGFDLAVAMKLAVG